MFFFNKKNKNNLETKIFVFVCLLNFFVLFFLFVFYSNDNTSNREQAQALEKEKSSFEVKDPFITKNPAMPKNITKPVINGDDPSIGARDAKINLIMFSDINCDFCYDQYQDLKEIVGEHKDEVRLVWKDYPDTQAESRSWRLSMAGRCAYKQDKFWEFYDLIYQDPELSWQELINNLNLSAKDFSKCLKSQDTVDRILKSVLEADSLGISGVPYLFVNDKEFLGGIDKDSLKKILEINLHK